MDEQSQALTAQGAELEGDDAEAAALELEAHMRATTALIARFHAHAEQWEALEVGAEAQSSSALASATRLVICMQQCKTLEHWSLTHLNASCGSGGGSTRHLLRSCISIHRQLTADLRCSIHRHLCCVLGLQAWHHSALDAPIQFHSSAAANL